MLENIKEQERKNAALEAVKFIKQNDIVGLGTGSTAFYAIEKIAELVKGGLRIQCVATSEKSAIQARNLGIDISEINEVSSIDVTIDGADEFTPSRQLIKGGGGALFREKIVASLSKTEIIITDSSKFVQQLGKFKLPVEVVPLAVRYVEQELNKLRGTCYQRQGEQQPFVTDNGNFILDTDFGLIEDPSALSDQLYKIDGIFAHGLFINLATVVIMGQGNDVKTFQ